MKRKGRDRRVLLAGIGGVVAGSFLAGGKAQAGTLEAPPGGIGPTGRSLSEIEPKTPINTLAGAPDAVRVISQGGSYKLTGDLTVAAGQVGIKITARDPVSIDLGGFAIRGGGGGGGGGAIKVLAPTPGGCAYVEVFDGYIRDLDDDGIDGGSARALECYDLHIDNVHRGIVVHGSLIAEACHIERCASHGIEWDKATSDPTVFIVDDTECRACGGHGIHVAGDWSSGGGTFSLTEIDAIGNLMDGVNVDLQISTPGSMGGRLHGSIQDLRASGMAGRGLEMRAPVGATGTGSSLVVQCEDVVCTGNGAEGMHLSDLTADLIDCVSAQNTGDGYLLENTQGSVDSCMATQNGGDGVHLTGTCRMSVSDAAAHSNTGAGIHLDAGVTLTAVQDNDVRDDAVGIRVQSQGNLLVRNTALGNGVNYDVPMPVVIITPSQMLTDGNPHANYSS